MTEISVHPPTFNMASRCEPILRALPDWFGIEQSIVDYVNVIDSMPTLMVTSGDIDVGFLTLKLHGSQAADAYVLGVLKEWHRKGIGQMMFDAGERWLVDQGVRFFQVKTVGASSPCPHYALTRLFYESIGFTELETFPEMLGWDSCPCLIMVKTIEPA